jgi:N-acetylneuraminate lyase
MTNLRLPIAEFLPEVRLRIPNLRGLKFSHSDLVELQECVHVDDGAFEVVFRQDEFLLARWCLGARGRWDVRTTSQVRTTNG